MSKVCLKNCKLPAGLRRSRKRFIADLFNSPKPALMSSATRWGRRGGDFAGGLVLGFGFVPVYKLESMPETNQITQVLQAIDRSESGAAEKLLPLVYEDLRRLATARMANEMS